MKQPILSIVVAAAENNVIGAKGTIPWYVSADLKNVKAITMGKPIVMGRKTFQSIGRPLSGRQNIVVSSSPSFKAQGADVVSSLNEALMHAKDTAEEIIIFGGGQIYTEALSCVQRIYLTRIHAFPEGDTRFPELDAQNWRQKQKEPLASGPKDTAKATFYLFERKEA